MNNGLGFKEVLSKYRKKQGIGKTLLIWIIFFIITNFGVWVSGSYGYTLQGFISCYILAIPFFTNTLISTFIFSVVIETIIKFVAIKNLKLR